MYIALPNSIKLTLMKTNKYTVRFLILILPAFIAVSCDNKASSSSGIGQPYNAANDTREMTAEERLRHEESWKSFEQGLKYKDALVLEEADIRTNSDYQSTYYFTVRNTSNETIIAFEINGKRFKRRIMPGKTYSGRLMAESEMVSDYTVESIVLASGEKIDIFGKSKTRYQ